MDLRKFHSQVSPRIWCNRPVPSQKRAKPCRIHRVQLRETYLLEDTWIAGSNQAITSNIHFFNGTSGARSQECIPVYRNCCKRACDLALAHGESLVQPFAGCEICGNLNIIQNSEADRDEYGIMTYLLVRLQFPISINPSTFQFAACRVDLARMVWSFHLGKLALQINTLMTMHTPCIFHNIITYYCSILLVICLLQIVITALLGATAFVLLSGCLCMSLYILLPCGGSGFQ